MSKELKEMLIIVIGSMLCMSKESKQVIKMHSNRLDIYIYCHVKRSKVHCTELNTLNVHMSKESKASLI